MNVEFVGKQPHRSCPKGCAGVAAPAQQRQVCLTHQLWDFQRLRDQQPQLQWAVALQALFREAIHLGKRRERLSLTGDTRRVTEVERRLDRLLAQRVRGADAVRLRARYRVHRAHISVFLHALGVPPDNNACERALRPSVIHRKVANGFRSEWRSHTHAALATISETSKLQGRNVFAAFLSLMGPPVLP
jgi:transposase